MAIFEESPNDELKLEDHVGEGKRYKAPEDLLKGKLEADQTIKERERELAELREELGKRLTVEDALKKLEQERVREPVREPAQTPRDDNPQRAALSDEDLVKRIDSVVAQRETQRTVQSNTAVVADRLLEVFGEEAKAAQAVRAKAAELGVSVSFLESVAKQSPKAFYAQMGLTEANAPRPTAAPSRGDVKTVVDTSRVKEGTYQWYEVIRKNDPKRYFSPATQNQLHKDAQRLGLDAFMAA